VAGRDYRFTMELGETVEHLHGVDAVSLESIEIGGRPSLAAAG